MPWAEELENTARLDNALWAGTDVVEQPPDFLRLWWLFSPRLDHLCIGRYRQLATSAISRAKFLDPVITPRAGFPVGFRGSGRNSNLRIFISNAGRAHWQGASLVRRCQIICNFARQWQPPQHLAPRRGMSQKESRKGPGTEAAPHGWANRSSRAFPCLVILPWMASRAPDWRKTAPTKVTGKLPRVGTG